MLPYYCNEAMLLLPNVRSLVDATRHSLEIVTEDGTKLDLVIARITTDPNESLHQAVERGLADQARSLTGYQVLSRTEIEYAGLVGIEIKIRFVDKRQGPLFHHVFHTLVDGNRVGFFAISTVANATACEAWMSGMLANMKPRT